MTTKEIQKDLKNKLKPARYEHTLGVSDTARHLAEIHSYDSVKAALAGLLHDCAKYMSDDKKIALCREYGISISDAEYKNPSLLHAKCGAILPQKRPARICFTPSLAFIFPKKNTVSQTGKSGRRSATIPLDVQK